MIKITLDYCQEKSKKCSILKAHLEKKNRLLWGTKKVEKVLDILGSFCEKMDFRGVEKILDITGAL